MLLDWGRGEQIPTYDIFGKYLKTKPQVDLSLMNENWIDEIVFEAIVTED